VLELRAPSGGGTLGPTRRTTVTLRDDDAARTVAHRCYAGGGSSSSGSSDGGTTPLDPGELGGPPGGPLRAGVAGAEQAFVVTAVSGSGVRTTRLFLLARSLLAA
jgi:hypothetical protein